MESETKMSDQWDERAIGINLGAACSCLFDYSNFVPDGRTRAPVKAMCSTHRAVAAVFREMAEQHKAEVEAHVRSGTIAMNHLHELSLSITKLFYPNFEQDGMAPACGAVELVKIKLDELRAKNDRLEQHKAEVERLEKERDYANSQLANISFVTPAFRDNALDNELANLRAELARLKSSDPLETIVKLQEDLGKAEAENDEYSSIIVAANTTENNLRAEIARLKQALGDAQQEPRK